VTKAVAIIAPAGVYAGISVLAAQDGVTVNAQAADKVVLRGLTINGQGGNRGIVVTVGGQIHIENCVVASMANDGIQVNGGTAVYVANSTLRSNNGSGLHVAGGAAEVHVDDTRIANNILQGIFLEAGSLTVNSSAVENNGFSALLINPATASPVVAAVRGSLLSGNGLIGFFAQTAAAGRIVHVSVDGSSSVRNGSSGFVANSDAGGTITFVASNSVANENAGNGIFATGAGTTLSVAASSISRNGGPGLNQNNNATLRSHGNNAVNGNLSSETTGTITGIGLM
jgi:hypothetical protein